jgi:hypothetical protein
MMNLLQVQDDLKNFSQDQLVKEMQQPSGSTPQFLVLSELNRRKRVKGDFEARQAQQQPTVAEEAVASAGVPQQGMMGMPEAMAPQSAVSEGVGTSAPMKMASGGLAQFGNEIRNSMGQEIDPYLDGVQQEAEQKFNIDLDNNPQQIQPGMQAVPRPAIPMPMFPRPGYRGPPPQIGIGGKGMARPEPAVLRNGRDRYFTSARINERFGGLSRGFAEGGVIRAQDGLPEDDKESYLSKFGSGILDFFQPDKEVIEGRIQESNPFGMSPKLSSPYTESVLSGEKDEEEAEDAKDLDQALNDAITNQKENKNQPKLNLTSKDTPLTIEEELLKRQADLSKSRDFDKYMALAQAGLAIMGSDKPTLAGAIGEGGTAGLTAFNEANKRYEAGLTDILNARSKLQQAKITAGAKGKLTRSGALSAITAYNNSITAIRKEIADLNDMRGAPGVDEQIKQLQDQIVGLETEKSQLYNSAKIRPRSSILVKDLPASQKEA